MLEFKRGLGKNNADYTQEDAYKYMKEHNPDIKISYKTYLALCMAFNDFLMQDMMYNTSDIYLPANLGSIGIRKYDCNPRINSSGTVVMSQTPVDYRATKAYWEKHPEAREQKKLIRYLNNHTNGYRHRFFWDKITHNFTNKFAYQFVPLRKYSRMLANILKDDNISIDFFLDMTKLKHNANT
jgi:hypothetical protein